MKFLSLFAFFSSVALSVLAAPPPCPRGPGTPKPVAEFTHFQQYAIHVPLFQAHDISEGPSRLDGLLDPTAAAFIAWLGNPTNAHALNAHAICFWSGFTTVSGAPVYVYDLLPTFVAARGCNLIYNIIALSGISSATWQNDDWRAVSAALATHTGNPLSIVLLGANVAVHSTWNDMERGPLIANANVQHIEQWNLQADGSIVQGANIKLWEKEKPKFIFQQKWWKIEDNERGS